MRGEELTVRNPDGSAARIRITRMDPASRTALAMALGTVKVGARGVVPGRLRIIEPPGQPVDPLLGQTVGVRFREKHGGTTYFLVKVLGVDWSRGGPVPTLTADFPGPPKSPPLRRIAAPTDLQQFVLFDAMTSEERNQALATWDKDSRDERAAAPYREWEEVARTQIHYLERGGKLLELWTGRPSPGRSKPRRSGNLRSAMDIFQ